MRHDAVLMIHCQERTRAEVLDEARSRPLFGVKVIDLGDRCTMQWFHDVCEVAVDGVLVVGGLWPQSNDSYAIQEK